MNCQNDKYIHIQVCLDPFCAGIRVSVECSPFFIGLVKQKMAGDQGKSRLSQITK